MSAHDVSLLGVATARLRVGRDQLLLIFAAFNLAFLVVDVGIAHSINSFRPVYEWIPVLAAWPGVATCLALAVPQRPSDRLRLLHQAAMLLNIIVGVLGTVFHLRAVIPPAGGWAWAWIAFGAPVLAPLSFAGAALVGLVASWHETPGHPGLLNITSHLRVRAPLSRTQHLLCFVALGFAGAALMSFQDHGQYGYTFWEWIPIATGLFATLVVFGRAWNPRPHHPDELTYLWTMILAIVVGVAGIAFHLSKDLADSGAVSFERMRALAPIFAPALFSDLGILGLIVALRESPASSE